MLLRIEEWSHPYLTPPCYQTFLTPINPYIYIKYINIIIGRTSRTSKDKVDVSGFLSGPTSAKEVGPLFAIPTGGPCRYVFDDDHNQAS